LVWASQLKADDFPAVCVMTGAPAETWYKVSFKTVPGWASATNVLAFTQLHPLAPVVEEVSMRRARGHLPMTRRSRQRLLLVNWSIFGLIPVTMVLWLAAAVIGSNSGAESPWVGVLVTSGLITVVAGLIGLVVVLPLVGPAGSVFARQPGYQDNLVELRRVHPTFVAAVNQQHANRAAQYASQRGSPSLT